MRARLLATIVAAFAIAPAAALAQEPTPTPTATPTPTPEPQVERSRAVRLVLRDYRRDGDIDACEHTRRALRKTLQGLDEQADLETPDLRPLLEAAIDQHDAGDCDEEAQRDDDSDDEGTATPSPTATPVPTTAPSTPVTPTTPATPTTPTTPDLGGGAGGAPSQSSPPTAEDVTPLDPEVTPVPPATTPAPATPPAEAAGPAATPGSVFRNADDDVPVPLLVLAALLALLALAALAIALASRFGWGETALAEPRRAWREAAFRAGDTWSDFADWIRVGR